MNTPHTTPVRLHALRNLQAFDDASDGCILPRPAALSGVIVGCEIIRDRLWGLSRSAMPSNDFNDGLLCLIFDEFLVLCLLPKLRSAVGIPHPLHA